jgi:hypothetical protein
LESEYEEIRLKVVTGGNGLRPVLRLGEHLQLGIMGQHGHDSPACNVAVGSYHDPPGHNVPSLLIVSSNLH